MRGRPMLVGMNNPLSDHPGFALYPAPVNCTGWRIWKMLNQSCGASRADYIRCFERRNLIIGRWRDREAPQAAGRLVNELKDTDRVVVVFGAKVRDAMCLARLDTLRPQLMWGCSWYVLPHPSGRCLWYNDEGNRRRAGKLLGRLYLMGRMAAEEE